MENKIQIFHDGPTEDQVVKLISNHIKGFTFNPSIFKKLKITDYLEACRKYANLAKTKPVSLEVIADSEPEIYDQAKTISKLSDNVVVKIPVMLTKGNSTYDVIKKLVNDDIKLDTIMITFGNQCNTACRICNASRSSLIEKQYKAMTSSIDDPNLYHCNPAHGVRVALFCDDSWDAVSRARNLVVALMKPDIDGRYVDCLQDYEELRI